MTDGETEPKTIVPFSFAGRGLINRAKTISIYSLKDLIISKVADIFIFYHIALNGMLDFKYSTWWLIRTISLRYSMSDVELMVNISK